MNNTKRKINTLKPFQVRRSGKLKSIDKRVVLRASLTVEAALGLPLILFSMFVLAMPMSMMETDRKMQETCEAIVADIAAAESLDGTNVPQIPGGGILDITEDIITLRLPYVYKLPFSVLGLGSLTQEVVASRRAWVGAKGSFNAAAEEAAAEDDEWVYVGKNSTRYHLSPDCHYLSNNYSSAIVDSNGRAAGLKPCDRCGTGAAAGQTVYVTPSGNRYHTSPDCSAMRSYPERVRKSAVEHLGCCSYCGG